MLECLRIRFVDDGRNALLDQLHRTDRLFHFAVVATQHIATHREARRHRFVVANTFRVVAAHDVSQFIRHGHTALFHHLVVANDAQRYIRRHHRELVQFRLGEKAVGDLHNALARHDVAMQIVADEHRVVIQLLDVEQANHGKELFRGNMVDDRAVFDGGHHEFFAFHRAEF